MTSTLTRPASTTGTATLRTLARAEGRRYARHPLFLVGVALLAATTLFTVRELADVSSEAVSERWPSCRCSSSACSE
jgi:hypothetical protein